MRIYSRINEFKLLNIKVILDDTKTLYEGMVEDIPKEIGNMLYSKVEMVTPITLYVYSELNSNLE